MKVLKKLLFIIPFMLLLFGCTKKTAKVITTSNKTSKITTNEKSKTTDKITTKKETTSTKKYTVVFDTNGGKEVFSNQEIENGEKIDNPGDPSRDGYTFDGWYYKNEKWSFVGYVVTEDMTLIANWTPNDYSLTLTKNISEAGTITSSGTHRLNDEVTIEAETNSPYSWLGWYDGDNLVCENQTYKFTMPNSSLNLEACWAYYTLTTSKNIATAGTITEYTAEGIEKGSPISITANTTNEYTWLGWYDGDDLVCENQTYTFNMPEKTVTYVACWTAYTVTVMRNNENYGIVSGSGLIRAGKNVTLVAEPKPTYVFDGWYIDGELVCDNPTYSFVMPKESLIIDLIFKEDEQLKKFTYDIDGEDIIITGVIDKTATEIIVPKYVTQISEGAFNGCSSLEKITLPFVGDKRHKSTDIFLYPFGYIFGTTSYNNSTETTQYYYGTSTTSTESTVYYIPTSLKEVTITDCSFIQSYAFNFCGNIEKITIPDEITRIEKSTFSRCHNLKEVNLPSDLTYIGQNAFYQCENTENFIIPAGVCEILNQAFGYCTGDIKWEDNAVIETLYGFNNYHGENVEIPASVNLIKYKAFSSSTNLKNVYFDGTVEDWCNIGYEQLSSYTLYVTNPMAYASNFYILDPYGDVEYNGKKFSLLTDLVIPDSITRIEKEAFASFECLTSIIIPDSVTTIGSHAFSKCSNVTSVILSKNVKTISNSVFSDCTSLKTIMIPNSVTKIYNGAFQKSTALEKVYYLGTPEEWSQIDIASSNDPLNDATKYYYSEGEPTTTGNYWHYNDSGVIVEW